MLKKPLQNVKSQTADSSAQTPPDAKLPGFAAYVAQSYEDRDQKVSPFRLLHEVPPHDNHMSVVG